MARVSIDGRRSVFRTFQRRALIASLIVPFLIIRSFRQQGLSGWGWTALAIFSYLVSCVVFILMGRAFEKHYAEEGSDGKGTENGSRGTGAG